MSSVRSTIAALLVLTALAAVGCGSQGGGDVVGPEPSSVQERGHEREPARSRGRGRQPQRASRSTNCMPQPSACGFPDVSTTGVKPGARLTRAAGTVTLSTPGEVYQNKSLRGSIVVTADHVTIRNVKLISTAFYAIQSFNVRGLKVQDTEIDMGGHLDARAISDDGFTLTRVFMHNGADCTTMGDAVTIEDSLCVLGPDANGDGWPDSTNFCSGAEHFDGFQSDGGHDLVIRHNTIRNPCGQTSAILMSSNSAPISDVTITDNLLAGGGYTLYCNAGPDIPNEKVTDNRVARTYRPLGGHYGPAANCGGADAFNGNVWDDTGRAIG